MTIELLRSDASPAQLAALEQAFTDLYRGMRAQGLQADLVPGGAGQWLKAQLPMLDKLSCVACAWEGDRLIGFAAGVVRVGPAHLGGVRSGTITHIHVAPEARRAGSGRSLYAACATWFRTKQVDHVDLEVLPGNPEGRAFWEGLGFTLAHSVLRRPLD